MIASRLRIDEVVTAMYSRVQFSQIVLISTDWDRLMDATLDRAGQRIHYRVDGTGPRVVWVDPALGSAAMRPLQPAIDRLADRFEVVTYDRRGRGRSRPGIDMSPAAEIEDLVALVTHLGGADVVIGFSSGGALVLHAATRLRTRIITLLEPAVDLEPDDSGLRERIEAAIGSGEPAAAVLTFYDATGVPPEIVDDLVASPAWDDLVRIAPTLLVDLDLALVDADALAPDRAPIHLIVSDGSPEEITSMSDELAQRVGAALWREPGGWHGVDADALAARLDALLAE
nr:alpha/beta hydrolase [Agromyces luteolus]